jgi:MoxR-like ATPase
MFVKTSLLKCSLMDTVKGKSDLIDLVLFCLFSEEHLLIKDVPGLGRTTVANPLEAGLRKFVNR